jgi:hypothetical protein
MKKAKTKRARGRSKTLARIADLHPAKSVKGGFAPTSPDYFGGK